MHDEDGAEELLLRDAHFGADAGKDRGRHEVPREARDAGAAQDGGRAFGDACRAERLDPGELAGVDQGAHVAAVDAGADACGRRPASRCAATRSSCRLRCTISLDPAEQIWPAWCEYAARGAGGRAVEIGVGMDDRARFAAEFHDARHDTFGGGAQHGLAGLDRPGEDDVVDVAVRDQRRARLRAVAADDIDGARRARLPVRRLPPAGTGSAANPRAISAPPYCR